MPHYDVIVIGLGAMGSSTCMHLARRGARVLGLEQFDLPHNRGSHHGHSRMIRLAYYEHPDYVPLLRRAYELWHELEKQSGEKLLHVTGGLYMGDAQGEFVKGSRGAAELHRLPHELLDRRRLADRYPQFQVPDHYVGFYEPTAGILLPERVVAAQARLARERGAELHTNEPVLSWTDTSVTTARDTYHAQRIVFCGGAWTDKLVRDLGVKLVVTRQVMGWLWPNRPERFQLGTLPCWAIDHPDNTQHYGIPILQPRDARGGGFKIAHHWHASPCDPDTVSREIQPGDTDDFLPALRRFIPDADGELLNACVCLYTNSPDSHFILDRHPRHAQVTVACGFSGHGFKFASVMGEALADLSMTGRTGLPVEFLSMARFAGT